MDEPARRETAVRALPDVTLLDKWDRAVERVRRNRDPLAQLWEQGEAAREPEPPGWEASEQSIERYGREFAEYENMVFDLTPLARGLLVGADEAERLGDEVLATLEAALRKATRGRFGRRGDGVPVIPEAPDVREVSQRSPVKSTPQ